MLLNKKTCVCGEDLRRKQFINYVPNRDITFYAGNVDMMAEHECVCGRKLKGFFKRDERGELKLIDLEVIREIPLEIVPETTDDNDIETEQKEPITDIPSEEKNENKPFSKAKKK